MIYLPPPISSRDLLNQVVDSLEVKQDESQLEQSCDFEYMSLLTDTTNPYPLHLVIGGDYLIWVSKYAFYHTIGLGMKTALICLESRSITHLLSLVSLATGIPHADLRTLSVFREHFAELNVGAEQIYAANPLFSEPPLLDLNGLIASIKRLKKHYAVEAIVIDALHKVRFDGEKQATKNEQSLMSSILKSTAHVGNLRIVAGFYDPEVKFPNLAADTVFQCDSMQQAEAQAGHPQTAVAKRVAAKMKAIWACCLTLMSRIASIFSVDYDGSRRP